MILAISVATYVAVMASIGLYASRKVSNSEDYVLAGRSLPFFMATATVFATWFGSETILGASGSFATDGFRGVIEDPFGAGLCLIIAGVFFNTKLYKLSYLTIGDFFKARYNSTIATLLSLAIIISYFGWVAAQLLALGIVVKTVFTGLTLAPAIILALMLVLAYTYFGGMMSVAFLDTIQSAVIIAGLLVVFVYAINLIGGIDAFIHAIPQDHLAILPANKDSIREWLLFITALMTMGLGSIPQQDVYQRAMSAKSAHISKWASILGGVLYFSIALIPIGIVIVARTLFPEMLATDPEHLITHLIDVSTPMWLQIIFFGALISAIISTASGALLAPATLLAENVIKPFVKNIHDSLRLTIIRTSVLVIGVASLFIALKDSVSIFGLVSSAYSITLVSAFVPLAAGLYSHKPNNFGALCSMIGGAATWLLCDAYLPNATIPPLFAGFTASVICMIAGTTLVKLLASEEKRREHDARVARILQPTHPQ